MTGLACRGEDGAEKDVVGAVFFGLLGLWKRMGGVADELGAAQFIAGLFDRWAPLAGMEMAVQRPGLVEPPVNGVPDDRGRLPDVVLSTFAEYVVIGFVVSEMHPLDACPNGFIYFVE